MSKKRKVELTSLDNWLAKSKRVFNEDEDKEEEDEDQFKTTSECPSKAGQPNDTHTQVNQVSTPSPGSSSKQQDLNKTTSKEDNAGTSTDIQNKSAAQDSNTPTRGDRFIPAGMQYGSAYPIKQHQSNDVPPQVLNKRIVRFQTYWYGSYPWLHYDVATQKMLCYPCVVAVQLGLHTVFSNHEKSFTDTGFNNFKKANEKFQQHSNSNFHKKSVETLAARLQSPISQNLENAAMKTYADARICLKTIITSIMFLSKQGLALRGDEHDKGNFMSLLQLRSDDVHGLVAWLKRTNSFTSWAVQNEILETIAHSMLRKVMKSVQDAKFYSLVVDETTDSAVLEQVSINVRVVNDDLEPREYFLGLYETSSTTGNMLYQLIRDVILRFNLTLENLRGQCYDGAANMSGRFKGVQAQIQEVAPRAIFVHCFNHSLNLALQDSAKHNTFFRDVFSLAHEIGTVIRASPKRMAQFNQLCADVDKSSLRPRPLCPTRWTVRVKSVESILSSYETLLELLEQLGDSTDNVAQKARGLKSQLEKGESFLGLQILKSVFVPCENLSKILQKANFTICGGLEAASVVVSNLQGMKTNEKYNELWQFMEQKIDEYSLCEPTLSRQRSAPKRYRTFDVPRVFDSAKEKLRSYYLSLIEDLCEEITLRFSQPKLSVIQKLEKIMLMFPNDLCEEAQQDLQEVCEFYGWNFYQLLSQVDVLKNVKYMEWGSIDKIVRSFRSLKPETRELFPDFCIYIKHLLVIPCSSAGAERSFSMLRRIKNYLRTTMSQKRLNHCCVINSYADELNELSVEETMQTFISKCDRENTFGKI